MRLTRATLEAAGQAERALLDLLVSAPIANTVGWNKRSGSTN